MSESETHKTVGVDGLIDFGQYLTRLADAPYRHYTFEMPDGTGRRKEYSLEDVITRFQEFCARTAETFRVSIYYVDQEQGTMGRSDRTFTRRRQ